MLRLRSRSVPRTIRNPNTNTRNMSTSQDSIPPGQGGQNLVSQQNPFNPVRPQKLDKYDGNNKDIRIQTWLTLFEVHTFDFTDSQRIRALLYNLKGIALEWYGDEIASSVVELTWQQVRDRTIRRFGISTSTPLIDAQRRRLKLGETVEQYFTDKMRLLRQTTINEKEITHQLTEGLPFSWKLSMTAAKPSDPNTWVEVAQQLETYFSSRPAKPGFNNFNRNQRPQNSGRPNPRALAVSTDKTPFKCRICERRGLTEYHWHRDCPHRDTNWQQNRGRPNNGRPNNDRPQRNYNNRDNTSATNRPPPGVNVVDNQADTPADLNE